jgi:hypothetical protein
LEWWRPEENEKIQAEHKNFEQATKDNGAAVQDSV